MVKIYGYFINLLWEMKCIDVRNQLKKKD